MDIIKYLARFIWSIINFLIINPLEKIKRFLWELKWKIRNVVHDKISRDVIVCFICALLVSYLTYSDSIFYKENHENVLYFLSSISQALAAFFALTFTISIFGAQTMGRFTALDRMMDKWTKLYMLLSIFGIIFPLVLLKTGVYSINLVSFRNSLGITSSLLQQKMDIYSINLVPTWNIDLLAIDVFVSVFCVLGIIPYLNKINRIAKYEGGISKLYGEAKDAINSGNDVVSSDNISRLGELGRSALKEALPNEVMDITTCIRNLGNLGVKNNLEKATIKAIIELRSLGLIAMDKKTNIGFYPIPWPVANRYMSMPEYPIAWNITNGFREICIDSIDKNADESIIYVSCEILFNIGYIYIQKIRTTFLKTISRKLRMILPNQLSLIEGDYSNPDTPTLDEMLLEIAEKTTKKKEPIFCWNDITSKYNAKKDLDKINNFFEKHTEMMYTAYNAKKANNNKTLILNSGDSGINYNFELNEEDGNAFLIRRSSSMSVFGKEHKSEPECVKILPIHYEDDKIYICTFKYDRTLEHSLIYLWIIGTYIMKNYPIWVTEGVVFSIKHSIKSDVRTFFESEYIRKETSFFITANDERRDKFEDLRDHIEPFQDFYFEFEDYLKNKRN